jgi:hypothetical protein
MHNLKEYCIQILVGKLSRGGENIKMVLKEIELEGVN